MLYLYTVKPSVRIQWLQYNKNQYLLIEIKMLFYRRRISCQHKSYQYEFIPVVEPD